MGLRRALEPDRGHILSTAGKLTAEQLAFLAELGISDVADEALWLEALTHGSTGARRDYERLEFLGDRVLGLVIGEWLYEATGQDEGKLSQRLNALVSGATCATIAREIGVSEHILLGKQAREDGGADSDNILGDVVESLIGACFIARGFEPSRTLVRDLWADVFVSSTGRVKHPKSALQEWAAGNQRKMPEYTLTDRSGPDHAAHFTVSVSIKGVGEVEASGKSKHEAEKLAAKAFMEKFG